MEQNINQDAFLAILKTIPLFQELNEEQHKGIIDNIMLEYYPSGHIIFSEGDSGDKMYIIKSGMVQISQDGTEVKMLITNDFLGEMALISDEPRNATAKVVQESQLFALKRSDFFKLIEKTPGLANRISTEFIKRLKENQKPNINPEQ
jgi:CRP/FNR family transcriptional regulator, cyclic AMP receptor protein